MATTDRGLQLAELGEFDDDPSADDVYEFALKTNTNMALLDITVGQSQNAATNLEQIEAKGVLGAVIYGGRLGTP